MHRVPPDGPQRRGGRIVAHGAERHHEHAPAAAPQEGERLAARVDVQGGASHALRVERLGEQGGLVVEVSPEREDRAHAARRVQLRRRRRSRCVALLLLLPGGVCGCGRRRLLSAVGLDRILLL